MGASFIVKFFSFPRATRVKRIFKISCFDEIFWDVHQSFWDSLENLLQLEWTEGIIFKALLYDSFEIFEVNFTFLTLFSHVGKLLEQIF